jgi:hypothetical protein
MEEIMDGEGRNYEAPKSQSSEVTEVTQSVDVTRGDMDTWEMCHVSSLFRIFKGPSCPINM